MRRPPTPRSHPPQIREAILTRLAAGEPLKAMCAEAGMPCPESVNGWMRRDAAFAAAVTQARAVGDERRRFGFDEAKAAAFLARVRAGEMVERVLADPAMPSRAAYRRWLSRPEFAAEMFAVRRQWTADRSARLRGRFRSYDPAVGERLYRRLWHGERLREVLRSDRAFPSLAVLARWRREAPEFDAMLRFVMDAWRAKRPATRPMCTPQAIAAVAIRIMQGASLRSLGDEPGMPSAGAMYGWYRHRPDFAQAVDEACHDRDVWISDQILDRVAQMPTVGVAATKRAIAPLNSQLNRLKKRPGWKRRR